MNIHEYQAKAVLAKYGVAILKGGIAWTPAEAEKVAQTLPNGVYVVKAQIHAGGRGKAGGVKIVKTPADVRAAAEKMLGMNLVTKQTGAQGRIVKRLYIEQGCDIKRELYLGLLIDRASSKLTFIVSTEGGMDIEEVAAATPEKIMKVAIDPVVGLMPFHVRRMAFGLGLVGKEASAFGVFAKGMYDAFIAKDAAMMEINPLVVTGDGQILALDAKIGFDDNALYRHPDIEELRDEDEEDPSEREAGKHQLSYVKLDGNIGCMVNGAGLAMATMDIIKLYGGDPANFLDVGGGATRERVTAAFKIILSDAAVEGILVNIFGGIMRCDVIAEGVVAAAREISLDVPLVVRLEGTNVALGKKILAESGLPILSADNLADAAQKIVTAVKEAA